MIHAEILTDKADRSRIIGFKIFGHSGYSDRGNDIICASVSALVINTINSIEKFTDDSPEVKTDEDEGLIEVKFIGKTLSEKSELLVNSMINGLKAIEKEQGFIKVYSKEV